VRVGADQAVGEGDTAVPFRLGHDHLAQILQVDLMDDARGRGHDAEILERPLAPLEELIPLAVALKLTLGVEEEGEGRAELIYLHRVVDDQIDGHDGVDAVGIAAQPGHGRAHRGQIDDGRHAGEVLQNDAAGLEGHFE
jgi:hypothetical protein